jgi:NhaC family Na+:H+ antiporter
MKVRPSGPTSSVALWVALIPVVFLVAVLWLSVVHYQSWELTAHIPLVLATAVACLVALRLGYSWSELEEGMFHGIGLATKAILILMVIGILVATWIQAGIVPTMIAYGLDVLSPRVFLPAACLICAFVSLASGSSWSTAATVGLALVGVGEGLGIPRPMIAGAIISGAYFGDKMSPLSDTTNLAPAMVGADLFEHIRHMALTTGPSLIIALVGFSFLGWGFDGAVNAEQISELRLVLEQGFMIHPLLLAAPLLVVGAVVLRLPALPSLGAGALLGAAVARWVQGASIPAIIQAGYQGFASQTGHEFVDGLLSRGGLSSMLSTVALIMCAMCFGGVMERAGLLQALARGILRLARGTGGLVVATIATCVGMNILAAEQYLAIVVPGRMFRRSYVERGLAPVNLSRALEDSATLTSVLIPWNTCGAFMIATLGLAPWTYVPYCFLNLVNPFVSAFYGFTGLTMRRLPPGAELDDTGSSVPASPAEASSRK